MLTNFSCKTKTSSNAKQAAFETVQEKTKENISNGQNTTPSVSYVL